MAVWTRRTGARYIIQSASRRAGRAWSKPIDLSGTVSGHGLELAVDSHVAIDGHGRAVAVWQRSNGSRWMVQSATQPARRR